VASVGTILAALGLYGPAAWSAGLYYLLNSTLVVAGLFLLAELVGAQRGDAGGRLEPASAVAQPVLLGLLLLLAAASAAGLPPLPGFIGKVMLLQAAWGQGASVAVWAVVLSVGFLTLLGLARAGSILFWHVRPDLPATAAGGSPRMVVATVSLVGASVLLSLAAAPVTRYTDATARQLADRAAYARAVLPEVGGERAVSVRPYTGQRPAPAGAAAAPADAGASR
jgi:multicomponent K+:H+ antiporter subunit D